MKSFRQWTRDLADQLEESEKGPNSIELEPAGLPDGLWFDFHVRKYKAVCRACGEAHIYDGDIKDFDQHNFYCGTSSWCCP